MELLYKKSKIIIILVSIPIILGIIYYMYIKDENLIVFTQETEEKQQVNEVKTEGNKDSNEEETEKVEEIVVHVSGCVNKEGLVTLPINSRIMDAIEKADGLKGDADISNINLAYLLEDGVKIYIPSKNELKKDDEKNSVNSVTQNSESNEIDKQNNKLSNDLGKGLNKNSKININVATQAQLETLPGIGPSLAMKIIEYRKKNGRFNNIEDIKEVSGIGENKYKNIKELITIK